MNMEQEGSAGNDLLSTELRAQLRAMIERFTETRDRLDIAIIALYKVLGFVGPPPSPRALEEPR